MNGKLFTNGPDGGQGTAKSPARRCEHVNAPKIARGLLRQLISKELEDRKVRDFKIQAE